MSPTVQIKLEIKRTQSVFKARQVETIKSNLQGSKAKAFFAANQGLKATSLPLGALGQALYQQGVIV
ncbi:MAG: hypothetical protein GY820_08570 [Gammaproteobacteria bacterium]|nr:hypothetical protein [Gammaproteobacteria bacterium]